MTKAIIVWMIVTYSYGGNYTIGGPEFTTEAKCVAATETINNTLNSNRIFGFIKKGTCVRIEK